MDFRPIAECLANTLSADTTTRISAELKLSELLSLPGWSEFTLFQLRPDYQIEQPETGSALSQLILAQDVDLSLRQMSLTRPPLHPWPDFDRIITQLALSSENT
jgi:importin-9